MQKNKYTWRLISVVAIALLVLLLLIAFVLIVRNIVFLIAFGLSLSLLVYATWLIVSSSHRKHRVGIAYVVIATLSLLAEFGFVLSKDGIVRASMGVAILMAAYLGMIKLLREHYWSERRQIGAATEQTADFTRPFLIINPKSGNGRAIKAHVDAIAKQRNIKVIITTKDVDMETVARQAVADGADVLGISGGDGSIGAIAKVALEHTLPVVVLPGGTRCHFARDLGLDPKRIVDALAGFHGVERRVDVGNINGRIFLNNASFGLYADIVSHPRYRDHKLEVAQTVLRSLATGEKPLYDLQFACDDQRYQQAAQVLVGVNRYNTVNIFELGHREVLDEGILQITALTELDETLVKAFVSPITLNKLGKLEEMNALHQSEVTSFRINSATKTLKVGVDGETETYKTPVTVRIVPNALRVYVPAEGARSRPKSPFSWTTLRWLWNNDEHYHATYEGNR